MRDGLTKKELSKNLLVSAVKKNAADSIAQIFIHRRETRGVPTGLVNSWPWRRRKSGRKRFLRRVFSHDRRSCERPCLAVAKALRNRPCRFHLTAIRWNGSQGRFEKTFHWIFHVNSIELRHDADPCFFQWSRVLNICMYDDQLEVDKRVSARTIQRRVWWVFSKTLREVHDSSWWY